MSDLPQDYDVIAVRLPDGRWDVVRVNGSSRDRVDGPYNRDDAMTQARDEGQGAFMLTLIGVGIGVASYLWARR